VYLNNKGVVGPTAVFRNCVFSGNTANYVSRTGSWHVSLTIPLIGPLRTPQHGRDVYTYAPFSDVTFVKCDGSREPMTDCCTIPVLPTCPPTPAPPTPTPKPTPKPASCSLIQNQDCPGNDLSYVSRLDSPEACCDLCAKTSRCQAFTFVCTAV
jgi:hypothetical protein